MKPKFNSQCFIELPSALDQVVAEIFDGPLILAGFHSDSLFGKGTAVMAAQAGAIADLTTLEAVAALFFLEWMCLEQRTSKIQRLIDRPLRKRYSDLKMLAEKTVPIIQGHLDSGGKFAIFTAEMVKQMKRTMPSRYTSNP